MCALIGLVLAVLMFAMLLIAVLWLGDKWGIVFRVLHAMVLAMEYVRHFFS